MGMTHSGSIYYATGNSSSEAMVAELDIERGNVLTPPRPVSPRYTGAKATPVWSPDGASLAYLFGRDRQRFGLSILTFPGGVEREILPKQLGSITRIARWHPDGESMIVDGTTAPEGGNGELPVSGHYKVSLRDGTIELIANRLAMGVLFSNDAKTAYYGGDALYARDLTTGAVRILARHPNPSAFTTVNLSLSSDGARLGVCLNNVNTAGRQSLAILPVTGGEPKILLELGPRERIGGGSQIWSGDDRYIIAACSENGGAQLWRIPTDGSGPRVRLPIRARGPIRGLRLHPDGRHLTYVSDQTTPEIWAMENAVDFTISQRQFER
jgi:Tol biopolymer transport system component